jgi:hypothetical protein
MCLTSLITATSSSISEDTPENTPQRTPKQEVIELPSSTPAEPDSPQKQNIELPSLSVRRYEKLPASDRALVRNLEDAISEWTQKHRKLPEDRKQRILGFDRSKALAKHLDYIQVAYYGAQSSQDQPFTHPTSSYQSATPDVDAAKKLDTVPIEAGFFGDIPKHMYMFGTRSLKSYRTIPCFEMFRNVCLRAPKGSRANNRMAYEPQTPQEWEGLIREAWKLVKVIDVEVIRENLNSVLKIDHGNLAPRSNRASRSTILGLLHYETCNDTQSDHGRLRYFREAYEQVMLFKAVEAELGRSLDSAKKVDYAAFRFTCEALAAKWSNSYYRKNPKGKPLLNRKFKYKYWANAIRQGAVWKMWCYLFSDRISDCRGILLLLMVAEYPLGFVDDEGDWALSWGLSGEMDNKKELQMEWVVRYIEVCLPEFMVAAKYLDPWALQIYETGRVSRQQRKDIIEGLKRRGFGKV